MSTQEVSAEVRGKIIKIDEQLIKDHLGEVVRGTVEETLNGLLNAEADRLCNAKRYERTASRLDTRLNSYVALCNGNLDRRVFKYFTNFFQQVVWRERLLKVIETGCQGTVVNDGIVCVA